MNNFQSMIERFRKEFLDLWLPEAVDVMTLDGDSRGMRQRGEDFLRTEYILMCEREIKRLEGMKIKLFHDECIKGKSEMCDACNDHTIYNQALSSSQNYWRRQIEGAKKL